MRQAGVWLVVGLTLAVDPRVQFAPGTVRVLVRLVPHADNRLLCVGIESDERSERSCRALDGLDEPSAFFFTFSRLPGAEYRASAEVFREAGAHRACLAEEACTPAERVETPFRVVRVVDCEGLTPQQCRDTH